MKRHIFKEIGTFILMTICGFSLGIGAVWRTGDFAFDRNVHQQLGLAEQDQIIGFLYVGTPSVQAPIKPLKEGRQFAWFL